MASSLAVLKNLPCPAGDKCDAFQCLFKHDRNTDARATGVKSTDQPIDQVTTASSSDQVLPRKRIKLDSTTSSSPHQSAISTGVQKPTVERVRATGSQSGPQGSKTFKSTNPVKRKLSSTGEVERAGNNHGGSMQSDSDQSESTQIDSKPHDGVRNGQSQSRDSVSGLGYKSLSTPPLSQVRGASTSLSKQQGPATSASTSATMGVHNSSKLATKTPPKKPEALNPRLLKSAPAKHDTRLKLVKALHEQYTRLNSELKKEAKDEVSKKLVLSDQELIVKTLDDEQEMAIKRPQIYGNVIRNKIMSYKRKTVSEWKEERMLATGVSSAQNTANVPAAPQPLVTGLTPPQEVDFLHRLVWPFNGLESYGYVHSVPADDDIEQARASVQASGNVEVCDRCTRRFQVFPGRREEDGALTTNGSCTFHPGKTYFTERGPGKLSKAQKKYRCCHQNVDDDVGGCATAPTHVFKTTDKNRLANLLNFAETPPNPNIPADRAICFDCEMGFTAYGLELIRMTVISWPNYETLADVLVQPYGEVLDLNTRYSGVTPEDMVSAERWVLGGDHKPTIIENQQKPKLKIVASPKEARDLLFSLISPDTPLVGHGLENDMNAMRIIHPTCIDTVLLFPHRRGLPHRNSLRMLMETLLNQKIQQETDETTPEGHDSAEDAKAAGELARLKVRDEWKNLQTKGWVIKDGKVTAPGEGEKYDLPY